MADHFRGTISRVEDSGVAAAPTYYPPQVSGSIGFPDNKVRIDCLTTNATVRYTFEQRDPIQSDPAIAPGTYVTITNNTRLRAQAFRVDLLPSTVASRTFSPIVTAAPKVVGLTQGSQTGISSNSVIQLTTATPGAQIFYTLNAFPVTTNSPVYSAPFTVNPGDTLRTFATRSDLPSSSTVNKTFSLATVPVPIFAPPSGPISNGTVLKIIATLSNSVVYYTLDGSVPTTNSWVYAGQISLLGWTRVRAFAVAPNYGTGGMRDVTYSLQQAEVALLPASGPIVKPTQITIQSPTPGAVIYYTTNSTTPTTNSTLYTEPITISPGTVVRVLVTAEGYSERTTGVEYINGDIDGDGIPDAEEYSGSGYTRGVDDRAIDSDTDGFSNADEYIAGTDPLSGISRLQITEIQAVSNGVKLNWTAASNRTYRLFSSSNFISWWPVTNLWPPNPSGSVTVTNTNSWEIFRLEVTKP